MGRFCDSLLPECNLTSFFGTPALLGPTEIISPRYGPMVTLLPQSLCDVPNRLALLRAFPQQKVPALTFAFVETCSIAP